MCLFIGSQFLSLQGAASKKRCEGSCQGHSQRGKRVCAPCVLAFSITNLDAFFRLLVLAADINPIDIISHLPVLSEEAQIPYVFVASKEELGHASSTKRPTSCVMICPDQKRKVQKKDAETDKDDDYRELYEECRKEVAKLDQKVVF